MKPDWKDAPEWARYLAMDSDGDWYWYEIAPTVSKFGWKSSGRSEYAGETSGWLDTLEERPKESP